MTQPWFMPEDGETDIRRMPTLPAPQREPETREELRDAIAAARVEELRLAAAAHDAWARHERGTARKFRLLARLCDNGESAMSYTALADAAERRAELADQDAATVRSALPGGRREGHG